MIDRYSVGTIDLDLESRSCTPRPSSPGARRHYMPCRPRSARRPNPAGLADVAGRPSGLTAAGSAVLAATLAAKVDVGRRERVDDGLRRVPARRAVVAGRERVRVDQHGRAGAPRLHGRRPFVDRGAGLAAPRGDADDRPERHSGRASRPVGRHRPRALRDRQPPAPAVDVVAQPRPGMRAELRRRHRRLGQLQWCRPARRAVLRHLRPVQGRQAAEAVRHPVLEVGDSVQHLDRRQPGDIAVRDLEPGAALPGGHEDRVAPQRLSGQVVDEGRYAGRTRVVDHADAVDAHRPGAAGRAPAADADDGRGHLSGLGGDIDLPRRRPRALSRRRLSGQVVDARRRTGQARGDAVRLAVETLLDD